MKYEFNNHEIITRAVEYSVSYHCNLSCAGCSHMSPFMPNHFPPLESFDKDINALKNVLHAGEIRLLGGEPLLNPQIDLFIRTAKESGIADVVKVTTNGILLDKMTYDFWENVDFVEVTLYPDIKLKADATRRVEAIARETKTKLNFFNNPQFRTTIVTRPHPKDWITNLIFKTCKIVHTHQCHMIHEGKFYKCAVPPFLPEYLSKIEGSKYDSTVDAFEIHESEGLFSDLKQFLLSEKTMDACQFCLGYLGKKQHHHLLKSRYLKEPALQKLTRRSHLDRYRFIKESLEYFWSSIRSAKDPAVTQPDKELPAKFTNYHQ